MSNSTPRFLSDTLIHTAGHASVHRVRYREPGGGEREGEYLRHPGAVVILPVTTSHEVVMIRNWRFPLDRWLLELPAGTLEPGEDPAAAAGRELAEETGYTAARIEKLGAFYSAPGTTDEVLHAYLAEELRPGPQKLEADEHITVELYTQRALRGLMEEGELRDAKTLAVLGLYWMGAATETNQA